MLTWPQQVKAPGPRRRRVSRSPDYFDIDQYRGSVPSLGLTTLYHTGIKIGTSYAAAAP